MKFTTEEHTKMLSEQNIEYIRNMQKLVIPTALGMSPVANTIGRVEAHAQLTARYWRATKLAYTDIRDMILRKHNQEQVRKTVDAIEFEPGDELFKKWHQSEWYAGFDENPPEFRDIIMGAFSAACQFNCDIRDVGKLNHDDMHVEDMAWAKANDVPLKRLNNKLRLFSLQSIAAMNYEPVGKYPLAAYVRAYGLGIGLLPATNSLSRVDWTFTTIQPSQNHIDELNNFLVDFRRPLKKICANILAMFGLFHLSKGHTFMPNNNYMNRICTSYIKTLRTEVSLVDINSMLDHKEAIVRIGPHPFGLAQTYWIARVMGHHGLLTPPLALRLDVTPPPVQKLMIAYTTMREWANMHVALALNKFFRDDYEAMREQIKQIKENSPAYSSLHRLYGIPEQSYVEFNIATRVEAMMPTIYKYIKNVHKNEQDERNGLGLAQCLRNMELKGV